MKMILENNIDNENNNDNDNDTAKMKMTLIMKMRKTKIHSILMLRMFLPEKSCMATSGTRAAYFTMFDNMSIAPISQGCVFPQFPGASR